MARTPPLKIALLLILAILARSQDSIDPVVVQGVPQDPPQPDPNLNVQPNAVPSDPQPQQPPTPTQPSIQQENPQPQQQQQQQQEKPQAQQQPQVQQQPPNPQLQTQQQAGVENPPPQKTAQELALQRRQAEIEAARSEQYRKEQARIQEIRQRQKEAEERAKRQMGAGETVNYESDGRVSRTEMTKREESQKSLTAIRNYYANNPTVSETFMFQTLSATEEFIFTFKSSYAFCLRTRVYTEENRVYSQIKDVQLDQPLAIYVYEDNARIVGQAEFYFENFLQFQVKSGSMYTIRFYNKGSRKLVEVSHPQVIHSKHIDSLYDKDKAKEHLQKGFSVLKKIEQSLTELRRTSAMDFMNSQTVGNAMTKFSYLQYSEMVVVLIITIVQVQLIKKMFTTSSIL